MLALTKKHHTEENAVELCFQGPASKQKAAMKALKDLGFKRLPTKNIPWREALAEFSDNEFGTALAGARYREGLTQRQLAEKTGIPQRHISEMENNKRPIGKNTAKLFATALNTDYRVFL